MSYTVQNEKDARYSSVLVNGVEALRLTTQDGRLEAMQIGDSATATHNVVVSTGADGSGKLARGVLGATTQDLITWNAAGTVSFPQNPADGWQGCYAQLGGGANVPATQNAWNKVTFDSEEFDVGPCFDLVNDRFQPTKAGYYQINFHVLPNAIFRCLSGLRKNGSEIRWGLQGAGGANYLARSSLNTIVHMNGSTDYIEAYFYCEAGFAAAIHYAEFAASLVRIT